ncbi:ribosome maturation factor RimP [Candidatus Poriferisodalis sp.]|uniref:ribosome maturation factor RimP n=1 Tax=Candidatus Poriferisodalis sp. TaxID=3101277 RepID=UPI003B024755
MTDTTAAPRAPKTSVHPSVVAELAGPIADEVGCALYDVQWRGGTLVVLVSAAAEGEVGVDVLSRLSRRLSAELDAADMIEGRYVLEVSSPGLERKLLRPEHFAGAVGERIVIRTSESPRRRIVGEITHADASGVSVHVAELSVGVEGSQQDSLESIGRALTVPYREISKARTTFEWGARPPRKSGPGSSVQSKSDRTARERQRR